jgi:hypothetical protein
MNIRRLATEEEGFVKPVKSETKSLKVAAVFLIKTPFLESSFKL